jgi:hypothetical protein
VRRVERCVVAHVGHRCPNCQRATRFQIQTPKPTRRSQIKKATQGRLGGVRKLRTLKRPSDDDMWPPSKEAPGGRCYTGGRPRRQYSRRLWLRPPRVVRATGSRLHPTEARSYLQRSPSLASQPLDERRPAPVWKSPHVPADVHRHVSAHDLLPLRGSTYGFELQPTRMAWCLNQGDLVVKGMPCIDLL